MRAFALLSAFAAVLAAPAASKRHHGNATIGGRGDLMTLATSDHWPCAVSESYKLTVTASKCFTTTELSKLYSATWPVSNAKFDSSKFSIKFESCPSSYGDDDDEAAPAVAAPLARPPQIEILKGKTKSSVAGAIVIRVCAARDCAVLDSDIVITNINKMSSALTQSVRNRVDCPTPVHGVSCREKNQCQCLCPEGLSNINGVCSCPTGMTLEDGECKCPGFQVEIAPGVCGCSGGRQLVNGVCKCTGGQELVGGSCACTCGQELVNGVCTCPGGQKLVGDKCMCTGGQTMVNDVCACTGVKPSWTGVRVYRRPKARGRRLHLYRRPLTGGRRVCVHWRAVVRQRRVRVPRAHVAQERRVLLRWRPS